MVQTQGGFEPMTIWPIYEKKKILAEGGFEPPDLWTCVQNATTELWKLITINGQK